MACWRLAFLADSPYALSPANGLNVSLPAQRLVTGSIFFSPGARGKKNWKKLSRQHESERARSRFTIYTQSFKINFTLNHYPKVTLRAQLFFLKKKKNKKKKTRKNWASTKGFQAARWHWASTMGLREHVALSFRKQTAHISRHGIWLNTSHDATETTGWNQKPAIKTEPVTCFERVRKRGRMEFQTFKCYSPNFVAR